jgi:hypothetical protein
MVDHSGLNLDTICRKQARLFIFFLLARQNQLPQSRNEQFLFEQEFGKLSEWLAIIKYEYGILPEWLATSSYACRPHSHAWAAVVTTRSAS